jgi:NAD(P) transhydrogenase subunit alpha
LIGLMVKDGELSIDWDDEILAGAVLTHDGDIINEAAKKAADTTPGE